ncbi:hypothetical protein BUE93_22120 [Chromobacterium amazonense]|uniref:Bacterial type II secretion system protein E domain-containing protein n=1 Tax=Chromobacterium amazonense TaxID=1382803 RepID=A0A2S9WYF5_9NEIS|nr:ATPase, T2SS/T4P/T4SS family [Chromobacterium amazonense]PRP68499.1 hypothetical protein BUE93_22120 [Chromobacterium amazonense]
MFELLSRFKKATPTCEMAEAMPLTQAIGYIRKAEKYSDRAKLYLHREAISKQLGIIGNDLSQACVLDMGQREAGLLLSENAVGQDVHLRTREKILANGYELKMENIATVALISDLNNAISRSGNDEKASDVKPLIDEILHDAILRSATDIHLICREKTAEFKFCIFDELIAYRFYEPSVCEQIAGYLFTVMADARSRSQNSFSLESNSLSYVILYKWRDKGFKLRVKQLKAANGWDVVIRLLPLGSYAEKKKTFADLGFEASQIEQLNEIVACKIGIMAITGPTGSGKSSTLKAALDGDPNKKRKKRYSIEDPVEYEIEDMTQISIQRDDHKESVSSFSGALKDLLRAAPKDIMVGEIRDADTARLTADAVLTGHKIFTTLHTNSAMGFYGRMNRLGIDRHTLADKQFVAAVSAQRLIAVLCEHCRKPAKENLSSAQQTILTERFGLKLDGIYVRHHDGCECCEGGVVSQTVVAEIIQPDDEMRELILNGRDNEAEKHWRRKRKARFDEPDMTGKTVLEHALYKASQGLVDTQEIARIFGPLHLHEVIEGTS